MIAKMKKLTILVSQKDANPALHSLRRLGLVHIKHLERPKSQLISSLENKLTRINKAVSLIKETKAQKRGIHDIVLTTVIKEILGLKQEQKQLAEKLKNHQEELDWSQELGYLSLADFENLKSKGIWLKLYRTNKRSLKRIPKDKTTAVIAKKAGQVYLAFFALDKLESLGFPEIKIPQESPQALGRKILDLKQKLDRSKEYLEELASYKDSLASYQKQIFKHLEFRRVSKGMALTENIAYLTGFCPQDKEAIIAEVANKEGWALISQEPDNLDEVPTLIKNPGWIRIIKPVFKFMETIPGYKEYDISFWFLLFFSVFFAMLIGDAGYGLFFLLVTFLLSRKFSHLPRAPFFLFSVLSLSTIIWGAMTGNWFGFQGIAKLPFFSSLVIERLNGFLDLSKASLMQICFFIGALQLSIAHGWIALKHSNSLLSLAHLGWVGIVWAIYHLASNLVLEKPFPLFWPYLLVSGLAMVIIFSNFQKNIFKGMLISIANLPLKLISSFADTLSYLRLFVIGYATLMIAASFNEIALTVGFNNIVRGLGASIILLIGHGLNIALGLMSVLVHGIRLNMLEFSGHLDMEWAGVAYEPFKE